MIPVFQTRFGGLGGGNCLSACVASILELPIDDVPDFNASSDYWFRDLVEWCAARNIGLIYHADSPKGIYSRVLCIEIWTVKDLNARHAIVSKRELRVKEGRKQWLWKSELIHDPSPKPYDLNEFEYVLILQPPVVTNQVQA